VTDDLSLAPYRIDTVEDGSQQLWLFDGDMEEVADVFEDRDAESNGHGWESFASWLLEAEMPDLAAQQLMDGLVGAVVTPQREVVVRRGFSAADTPPSDNRSGSDRSSSSRFSRNSYRPSCPDTDGCRAFHASRNGPTTTH
jgi:hypothetical protein